MREAFGKTITLLAKTNKNIWVVNADLKSSLFLSDFALRFKNRFVECGVAESNAAGVAAALAKSGKTVFLTSFACFSPAINWAVIKQSICFNDAHVIVVGSHAGLMSGDLGATHQMLEDIALMRSLPNMEVFAPIDALETTKIIRTLVRNPHPSYLRLVRPSSPIVTVGHNFTIGKSAILQHGQDITVCGYGPILTQLIHPEYKKYNLEIINCSSLKPFDESQIIKSVKKTGRLLVIEDHQQNGGFGEALAHLLLSKNIKTKFKHLSISNKFGQSASDYLILWDYYGLGPVTIHQTLQKILTK